MNPVQIITTSDSYTNEYNGEYFDWHQVHIFSFNQMFSTYFHPETMSQEQLKEYVQNRISEINNRSERGCDPSFWQKEGKFLIGYTKEVCDQVELFEFDPEFLRYEQNYDYNDFFEFLGERQIDEFLANALVSVGASDLIETLEPVIQKLKDYQSSVDKQNHECRTLDLSDPKYIIEIYNLEKDYVPVKVKELKSNQPDITLYLPENRHLYEEGSRKAYKVIDLETGMVVENTIDDKIESIRYMKHLRKNPPVMDAEALYRMELDEDDPNFLSYDDYVANDDEEEEGDADYIFHANKPKLKI